MQCDVSTERQSEIDRLVSGKSFLTPKQMPSSSSANSITSAGSANALDSISTAKKEARPAKIEESSYNVVWSVLFLVEVMELPPSCYINHDVSTVHTIIPWNMISIRVAILYCVFGCDMCQCGI